MLRITLQFAVLWAALSQSPAVTLQRTGDYARQLKEKDVAALKKVLPPGTTPWLLDGCTNCSISAYLNPTTATASLRRGIVIKAWRRSRWFSGWKVLATYNYAQVSIAGRSFDHIEGDQDLNRPFEVYGHFDDTELVQIVGVLRSNLGLLRFGSIQNIVEFPDRKSPGALESIQEWPIWTVERQPDDSVLVHTLEDKTESSGQSITLLRDGTTWVVLRVGQWSIDI